MKSLLKISFAITLLGILLISFISNLDPKQTKIQDITEDLIDKTIKTQGEIFNIRTYEEFGFQIISIKNFEGLIEVKVDKILNINENQEIIVIGKVEKYEDSLQIHADKIIIVQTS